MTTRSILPWAVALGVLGAATAAQAETIRIGVIGPLSGPVAVYGTEPLAAARFAVEEINASGMLGDYEIELIEADSTANPGRAAQAAQRMIRADRVMAIIGGMTSSETQAVMEVTGPAEIPQLSPLAQATNLTQQGNEWFARISQNADTFGQNAARWLLDKHAVDAVFVLARNDNYGLALADAFEAVADELGIGIAGRVAYEPQAKDFKPILSGITGSGADFVAIMGFYTDTGLIVKQMGELGIDVPVYANTSPAIPQYQEIAGPAADGSYGAIYYMPGSIDTEAGRSFVEKWQADTGREPSQYEGMGYDAAYVIAEAIRRAAEAGDVTPETIRDALFTIADFPGATGDITILPNGDVERPLPFVQLVGGELKLDFLVD